jgi:hypothetical protein
MSAQPPTQQVEVTCLGTPPARRIERASGVSEVLIEGQVVRCLVAGSFQPFLEALRGCEVTALQATPAHPKETLR